MLCWVSLVGRRIILTYMKKLFVIIGLGFLALGLNAQISANSVGLRVGGSNNGVGTELAYQTALSKVNRLEIAIGSHSLTLNGYGYSYANLTGMYQFVYELSNGFNWYYAGGAELGIYKDGARPSNDGSNLSVGAQAGIEYDFTYFYELPMLISLDNTN